MDILRTPEDRFQDLPGFPFAPHYSEVPTEGAGDVRIHYLDEGSGPVALLLHGEPSWSYLYRKMIPVLTDGGMRVVVPDLVGFGRSDKPADRSDYTFARHVDWIRSFIEDLGLGEITLFCQDWGGLIGLRLLAEDMDRFARVVASNTFLPTGDQPLGDAFFKWRAFSQEVDEFPIGETVARGCVSDPPREVISAYDAPFPDESFKEGARQFPMLVPASPDDPAAPACRNAWELLAKCEVPFLTAFGDSDPITRGADMMLQAIIPGAQGQPHTTVAEAGHFCQEDKGEELARITLDLVERTTT